jgi:hypothetical protein
MLLCSNLPSYFYLLGEKWLFVCLSWSLDRECLLMHFDAAIPNGDFPVLFSFGIVSSLSGIF